MIVGAVLGAVGGFGYHVLMRAVGSNCINRRRPWVPVLLGALVGVGVGWWRA